MLHPSHGNNGLAQGRNGAWAANRFLSAAHALQDPQTRTQSARIEGHQYVYESY